MTALECEARPLVQRFGLRHLSRQGGFHLYGNDALSLLVSGMGRYAMTAAVNFLAGLQSDPEQDLPAGWLNIGIAGHPTAAVGTGLLINRITESASGMTFFPPQLCRHSGAFAALVTQDSPEEKFPQPVAYDMEGSAFFASANRYVSAELVQLFKVVSDNRCNPSTDLNPARISQLVDTNGEAIEAICVQLRGLSGECCALYGTPPEFRELSKRVRLTVSQSYQLLRACRHYRAMGGRDLIEKLTPDSLASAAKLIRAIDAMVVPA